MMVVLSGLLMTSLVACKGTTPEENPIKEVESKAEIALDFNANMTEKEVIDELLTFDKPYYKLAYIESSKEYLVIDATNDNMLALVNEYGNRHTIPNTKFKLSTSELANIVYSTAGQDFRTIIYAFRTYNKGDLVSPYEKYIEHKLNIDHILLNNKIRPANLIKYTDAIPEDIEKITKEAELEYVKLKDKLKESQETSSNEVDTVVETSNEPTNVENAPQEETTQEVTAPPVGSEGGPSDTRIDSSEFIQEKRSDDMSGN